MCTLTLVPADQHLIITMNRDESIDRSEGQPHKWMDSDHPKRWFGTDAATGGSWFGVNEYGLAVALLNRYQEHNPEALRSRGELIPSLLGATSRAAAENLLGAISWPLYDTLDIFLIDHNGMTHTRWNGRCTQRWYEPPGPSLYTSASAALGTATLYRQRIFKRHIASGPPSDPDRLIDVHRTRCEERPALGLLMERPGRHTKSLCQVILGGSHIHARYLTRNDLLEGLKPLWERVPSKAGALQRGQPHHFAI